MTITQYINTLISYWQHLDMFEIHPWKCTDDAKLHKKIVEQKRTFKFLLGLNKDLDDVRGRFLSTKPLLSVREAFSEVRRKQKEIDYGRKHEKPGHFKDNCWKVHGKPVDWRSNRACQDRDCLANVTTTSDNTIVNTETNPFTKEQILALQKILGQISPTAEQHRSMLVHQGKSSFVHIAESSKLSSWIVDSGASEHMTGDVNVFYKFSPHPSPSTVRIADGSHSKVAGIGSIKLTKNIILSSVLYVPKLDCNLISVGKLTRDLDCVTKFYPKLCEFHAVDSGKVIGSAEMCGGLYLLNGNSPLHRQVHSSCVSESVSNSSSTSVSVSNENNVMLWHYRLGHPNFVYLERMLPHLFINKNSKFFHCEICQLAKHTRHVYPSIQCKPSHLFSVIHSDIRGPSRKNKLMGLVGLSLS
ncbi:hypothetical protein LIER_07368 [Lithospermum erythrorhizon]|uniref:GAG-pre-integrase domain-containing protein n=1 Tax=Lithospermum erythrorhizon TaxID=34254 RepID=A0AAV3P7T3_LITER